MNQKEKSLFEGMVMIGVVVILFGWFIFRVYVNKIVPTPPQLVAIPTEALADPVFNEVAVGLESSEKLYQVPVAEPTPDEKDKGSLVQ